MNLPRLPRFRLAAAALLALAIPALAASVAARRGLFSLDNFHAFRENAGS
jgi:hypothetical protein